MTPAAHPALAAARGARRWGWWLALAVAVAQCLASWHVYSHPLPQQIERPAKSAHAVPDSCALCVAAASLGGAPAAPAGWLADRLEQPGPAPLAHLGRAQSPAARPYAIRAPPPPLAC